MRIYTSITKCKKAMCEKQLSSLTENSIKINFKICKFEFKMQAREFNF